MANTPISVRLDEELLGFVDAEASRRRWSRNAVIQACIEEGLPDLEKESVGQSRKKIADVSDGGEAQSGGTQDLPRGGKAQDEEKIKRLENFVTEEGFIPDGYKNPPDMATLRDICAGDIPETSLKVVQYDHTEVDLCGFKSYNEIDGENYMCGKEKHGPKVKHGEWIKI